MEDFEIDIFWDCLGQGTRQSRTGLWIKKYLEMEEQDFIHHMHKNFCRFCDLCLTYGEKEGYKDTIVKIRKPSSKSFYTYIWALKTVGLIKIVGTQKASKKWLKRRNYYGLTELGRTDHPGWRNPFKEAKQPVGKR